MSDDVRFDDEVYGAPALALLPALCLILLVITAVRRLSQRKAAGEAVTAGDVLCFVPYPLLLTYVLVWQIRGIGAPDPLAVFAFCLVVTLCGLTVLSADAVLKALPVRTRAPRLALACALCGVMTLEGVWNDVFYTIAPQFWLIEAALVGAFLYVLWLLAGRRGIGPCLGILALAVLGTVQHYVVLFRGTSILPSDLYALGTALSVSGGYTYGVSNSMLVGFGAAALGLTCATLLSRHGATLLARRHVRDLALVAAAVAGIVALVTVPSYGPVFGADLDYWWSKDWYQRQGFLPSYIYAWQDLDLAVPEDYTDANAEAARERLASRMDDVGREDRTKRFQAERPNVLVIQNETFCDLSEFDQLRNGYTGPRFWNEGMPDAVARGRFAMSVFGGGTCNTEFEFLTGSSLAFVGASKYPFTMYDLSVCDSLPKQLGAEDYRTIGMHPNVASNWNRNRAYEMLGFDEFLTEDDFVGAEVFHTHTSDWATYERSLELMRESDEPVFVFDVTMQNHSGYDTGSIPEDKLRGYTIDGLGAEDTFQLNEFLACIDESDLALERLVGELREFDEPTVVVMYGDHHPWFSATLNDLIFPNEDELVHGERIHQTCYVMWANYGMGSEGDGKVPEQDTGGTSADLLAAQMLDAMGAPLSSFQEAQLGARADIRAINADGLLGSDDVWHKLKDPGPYADTYHDLELVEYLAFGSRL